MPCFHRPMVSRRAPTLRTVASPSSSSSLFSLVCSPTPCGVRFFEKRHRASSSHEEQVSTRCVPQCPIVDPDRETAVLGAPEPFLGESRRAPQAAARRIARNLLRPPQYTSESRRVVSVSQKAFLSGGRASDSKSFHAESEGRWVDTEHGRRAFCAFDGAAASFERPTNMIGLDVFQAG